MTRDKWQVTNDKWSRLCREQMTNKNLDSQFSKSFRIILCLIKKTACVACLLMIAPHDNGGTNVRWGRKGYGEADREKGWSQSRAAARPWKLNAIDRKESRIPNWESRIENPELRISNWESRIPNPEFRIENWDSLSCIDDEKGKR